MLDDRVILRALDKREDYSDVGTVDREDEDSILVRPYGDGVATEFVSYRSGLPLTWRMPCLNQWIGSCLGLWRQV